MFLYVAAIYFFKKIKKYHKTLDMPIGNGRFAFHVIQGLKLLAKETLFSHAGSY
jgi:hypothetical protein